VEKVAGAAIASRRVIWEMTERRNELWSEIFEILQLIVVWFRGRKKKKEKPPLAM
jgi:hypothetical protein